tara:strand:- start:730 stop:1011 length:282 start_codon:yes stop_codon:yes gene_type:complete
MIKKVWIFDMNTSTWSPTMNRCRSKTSHACITLLTSTLKTMVPPYNSQTKMKTKEMTPSEQEEQKAIFKILLILFSIYGVLGIALLAYYISFQ